MCNGRQTYSDGGKCEKKKKRRGDIERESNGTKHTAGQIPREMSKVFSIRILLQRVWEGWWALQFRFQQSVWDVL